MAFSLKEPIPFILTFFSSNFIILISLALFVGFAFRIIHNLKQRNNGAETEKSRGDGN
ncbi:MAG: hypothetical protein KKA41_05595 [Proteobacteria bacterium]|nr:hypothetical protein [Pseudomonadota bacterium]MBU4053823.1 hypothetical protein [Pseudomonadota bacterium]